MIDEVPTLCASDFCRKPRVLGERLSLFGWMTRTAGLDRETEVFEVCFDELHGAVKLQVEQSKYFVQSRHAVCCGSDRFFGSVGMFNDDKKVPEEELARVWNAAMTELGYDEEIDTDGTEVWTVQRLWSTQ